MSPPLISAPSAAVATASRVFVLPAICGPHPDTSTH